MLLIKVLVADQIMAEQVLLRTLARELVCPGRWPSRPDQRRGDEIAAPGDDRVWPSRSGSLTAVSGMASE